MPRPLLLKMCLWRHSSWPLPRGTGLVPCTAGLAQMLSLKQRCSEYMHDMSSETLFPTTGRHTDKRTEGG